MSAGNNPELYRVLVHEQPVIHELGRMIENPISFVKNTRQTYSRQFESIITEVQVQFADENPCWIPLETLIAMEKVCNE